MGDDEEAEGSIVRFEACLGSGGAQAAVREVIDEANLPVDLGGTRPEGKLPYEDVVDDDDEQGWVEVD